MSVTLTGTGGLFTRLGQHQGRVKDANAYLGNGDISAGGLKSVGVGYGNIDAQYLAARQDLRDQLYASRNAVRRALDQEKNDMAGLAMNTLTQMLYDDAKVDPGNPSICVTELIRQMIGSGSIAMNGADSRVKYNSTAVGSITAQTGNTGTGVVVASLLRTDGRTSEYCNAETIAVTCTGDNQSGTATLAGEPFSAVGTPQSLFGTQGYDAPLGSGFAASVQATDASVDATANLLTNSDFETFTVANTPDNWDVSAATPGTDLFKYATPYKGSFALEFRGTGGGPNTAITQTFNLAGGTTGTLTPSTVYAINFWAKKSASLAAGVIELALVDGSGTILQSYVAGDAKKTVANGTLTTSYAAYNGFVVTPAVMPSTAKFRVKISTALTSGESIYLDRLALVAATPTYAGGPWLAAFSGATAFITGDRFAVPITNDYGGKIQMLAWTLLGLPGLSSPAYPWASGGLQLPSDNAAGQTISESLVA